MRGENQGGQLSVAEKSGKNEEKRQERKEMRETNRKEQRNQKRARNDNHNCDKFSIIKKSTVSETGQSYSRQREIFIKNCKVFYAMMGINVTVFSTMQCPHYIGQ